MSVAFIDLKSGHDQAFKEEFLSRVSDIVDHTSFVEGPYNKRFEERFASYHEVEHALLVGNCTDGLEICLKAIGIEPGDLVAVPNITFYATAEAVLNVGAIPVLVDVKDDYSCTMDPQSLEFLCKQYPIKSAIPVHIYGLPADLESIEKLAQKYNFTIVEDAAQAFGTTYLDTKRPVGSRGNLTAFSFYPTKNLSALGDAGVILTSDKAMANKITSLRNHGRGQDQFLGRNSRCDHIQAAALDLKFDTIVEQNQKRKSIAASYNGELSSMVQVGCFSILPESYLEFSSWHLYPLFLENPADRAKLQTFLSDKQIGSAPFYDQSLDEMPALANCSGQSNIAKKMAKKALCIPMHPYVSEKDIQEVKMALEEFYQQRL